MSKYNTTLLLLVFIVSNIYYGQIVEKGFYNIDASTFKKHINSNSTTIIDIRTPTEYQQGHIKNSKNINYFDNSFKTELEQLDKNSAIYIYCRSGNRSLRTMQIMKELGFLSVYNLKGGFLAWSQIK